MSTSKTPHKLPKPRDPRRFVGPDDQFKTLVERGGHDPEQSQRFIKATRELGADQSEEAFNEALGKIARAPATPRGGKSKKPKPEPSE